MLIRRVAVGMSIGCCMEANLTIKYIKKIKKYINKRKKERERKNERVRKDSLVKGLHAF